MEKTDIIMSEEKKQRLKEYQKNYCETKKSQSNNEQCILLFSYTLLGHLNRLTDIKA